MLREMTAQQLTEWLVYEELEPFDEERADLRTASVVATLHNIHRAKTKQSQIKDIWEVALLFGDSRKPVVARTWQQLKSLGRMCAIAFGAKIS